MYQDLPLEPYYPDLYKGQPYYLYDAVDDPARWPQGKQDVPKVTRRSPVHPRKRKGGGKKAAAAKPAAKDKGKGKAKKAKTLTGSGFRKRKAKKRTATTKRRR